MIRASPSYESCYDLSSGRRRNFVANTEEGDLIELEEDTLPGSSPVGGDCGTGSLRRRIPADIDPGAPNSHAHGCTCEHAYGRSDTRSHSHDGSNFNAFSCPHAHANSGTHSHAHAYTGHAGRRWGDSVR